MTEVDLLQWAYMTCAVIGGAGALIVIGCKLHEYWEALWKPIGGIVPSQPILSQEVLVAMTDQHMRRVQDHARRMEGMEIDVTQIGTDGSRRDSPPVHLLPGDSMDIVRNVQVEGIASPQVTMGRVTVRLRDTNRINVTVGPSVIVGIDPAVKETPKLENKVSRWKKLMR